MIVLLLTDTVSKSFQSLKGILKIPGFEPETSAYSILVKNLFFQKSPVSRQAIHLVMNSYSSLNMLGEYKETSFYRYFKN